MLTAGIEGTRINKKGVFTVGKDRVAYSSSFARRLGARLLDIIIGSIPGFILMMIFNFVIATQPTPENVVAAQNLFKSFDNFIPSFYNPMQMISAITYTLGLITTTMVIPIFNKKYIGQSLGKRILSITPMYSGEFTYGKFILRELIIIGPILITHLLSIVAGADPVWAYVHWNSYAQAINESVMYTVEPPIVGGVNILPYATNPFDFFANIWGNENVVAEGFSGTWTSGTVMGDSIANGFQAAMGWTKSSFQIIVLIWLALISLTILFDPVKRSIADKATNIAIIDERTLQTEKSFDKAINNSADEIIRQHFLEEEEENTPPITLKK